MPSSSSTLIRAAAAALTAFSVTFLLTPLVRAAALRFGWVSKPLNDRWGRRVTARLGGVAMYSSFVASSLIWIPHGSHLAVPLLATSLVFILGLVDDLWRLPPYAKLVAQLLIGCVIVMSGIRIQLIRWLWLSVPLSVLWFTLIINAFNLMDNMDGLAAGIGMLASGFCAFHAAMAGQWAVVTFSSILFGSCFGFLRFNFPPAKIFMGDSGSHFLGLSLAMLALMGTWQHSTQLLSVLLVPVFVLAVPIFDTCFVTLQRLAHGQHPFAGGTDHVSHRLALLGLSARQTAVVLYLVSGFLGLLSIVLVTLLPIQVVIAWAALLSALLLIGRYLSQVNVYRIESPSTTARQRTESATFIETMLMHKRRLVEILVDFSIVSCAYVAAYLLRFEGVLGGDLQRLIAQSLPLLLVIKISCFAGFGLYRGLWRYLGLSDILSVFKAVTLSSLLSMLVLVYAWRFVGYSRSVLIIDWMLTFLAVGGSRVVERLLDEWVASMAHKPGRTIIVGAGDTGARVLRFVKYGERRTVLGLLDDDPKKHGSRMLGTPVLGGRQRLPSLLADGKIDEVLVAITDPPGELLEFVRRSCGKAGIRWKVVTAGVQLHEETPA